MKEMNGAIQEALVALLAFDKDSALQIAALVDKKYYDKYYREIAESLINYLETFGEPANEHFIDLISDLVEKKPDSKEVYERHFYSIQQTAKNVNASYVLDKVALFIRKQNAKLIIQKAIPLLSKDDETSLTEAENLLLSVGNVQDNNLLANGTLFNDPFQTIKFLDSMKEKCLLMGIPPLDTYKLGPRRKGSHLALAGYGKGKSWYCTHLGKTAIKNGLNVLHISLEMDEEEMAWRYVQSFFSMTEYDANVVVRSFDKDELGRYICSAQTEVEKRPHLQQEGIKELLINKLDKLKNRSKLFIKSFPSGQMTVRMLKAYLDKLERLHKFIPDEVIIDYIDIMKNPSKDKREGIGQNMIDLTGVAQERNYANITVSQLNREGNKTGWAKGTDIAEDISKNHTAQTVLVLNQTEAEEEMGFMRIHPDKARHTKKAGVKVALTQNFDIGQFCLDSCFVTDKYISDTKKD
jgi:replicative DNA helicase